MKHLKKYESFFDFFKKKKETPKIEKPIKDLDFFLDIEKFNNWFNDPNNDSYANPGIFLRLDKFGVGFFDDYFNYMLKQYDIREGNSKIESKYDITDRDDRKFYDFQEEVRKDWEKKKEER